MARTDTFTASDGVQITYYSWIPRNKIQGVVLLVHGMAEHARRYEHFAVKLRTKGFAVFAPDLRGHGQTGQNSDSIGYFAEKDGWFRVIEDLFELSRIVHADHPGQKLYLFGHSMGSFLSRTLMINYGSLYDGVILSGTGSDPGLLGKVGKFLAYRAVKKDGGRKPNKRLNDMSFGSYNKPFRPNRTEFDWLSRDEQQVDTYIGDPLCGFVCTSQFYHDLLSGLQYIHVPSNIAKIPKDLPVLLVSGTEDPVGAAGKGVKKVCDSYRAAALEDVSLNLFPGARHEILNETNRNEIENFCIRWIADRSAVS